MMNTTQERRRMRRFDMHLPALIRMARPSQAADNLQQATHDRASLNHSTHNHSTHNHSTHNHSTSSHAATGAKMAQAQEISVQSNEVHEFWTETQNVSARGIFFYLDRTLAEGSQLEITMTFPPHITMSGSVRVKFAARVIRVETPLPVSRTGIAAVIEDYEFLKAIAPGQIDFQKNVSQKNDFQKN